MSGHSKWSKVKHQKAVTDVLKASSFTKASHAIMVAVKEGGGIADPNLNFRLRLAVEKARDVNMPKENIDRIIEKAKGGGGGDIVTALYEGYGPGGVAILIETASDNANRTVSTIKNTLEHHGGTMVGKGAVSYLFDRAGVCIVAKQGKSIDAMVELALVTGAEDVCEKDECFEIYTHAEDLAKVKEALEKNATAVEHAELIMKPKIMVEVLKMKSSALEQLEEQLEALDDVQRVFTNSV